MKSLTLIACLAIGSFASAQFAKSPKLGEHDGIPGINLTKEYHEKIPGLLKKVPNEAAWSDLKEANYVYDEIHLAHPGQLKYENVYGLDVERIEVLTSNQGEYGTMVYAIAVFLELPETEAELDKFYKDFLKAYEPSLGADGVSMEGYYFHQWHSTNSCGAMMNLPDLDDLSDFKKYDLKFIEIQFTPSCGG